MSTLTIPRSRELAAKKYLDRLDAWRKVLAGDYDKFSDEDFAKIVDIPVLNRKKFETWLKNNPSETDKTVEEVISKFIVAKETNTEQMVNELLQLTYTQGRYEGDDYLPGSWDYLCWQYKDFHILDEENFMKIRNAVKL